MPVILKNNVFGFLAATIGSQDTTFTLRPAQVASFPALGEDDYFYATLLTESGASEIVKVTALAGVLCTMVRAQEDTEARAFTAGSLVELRVTAQAIIDAINDRIAQSCDCEGPVLTLLTSQPYPVEVVESVDSTAAGVVSGQFRVPNVNTNQTEALDSTGAGLVSGEFRALLFTAEQTEAADSTAAGVVSGEFRTLLFTTNQTEAVDSTGAGIVSGEFRVQRIDYSNYPAESADSTGAGIIGGVHETA